MVSSTGDYDGDGDEEEGVAEEIVGLQEALLVAIQDYALNTAGAEIKYDSATYPYFLGADGAAYSSWTARLLKAAYNYQLSVKDPGAFAHGGKYIIELLHDSLADLGVDVSAMAREDAGHFAGNSMAFRDWDDTGTVPYNCAKCHSATGLPEFIKNGGTVAVTATGSIFTTGVGAQHSANGFMCSTCHDESNWPNLYAVGQVVFPSGKSLTFSTEKTESGANVPVNTNICLMCHQGRTSKLTIDNNAAVKATEGDDTVNDKIGFQNIHYFAAGATLFGVDSAGAYTYADKEYAGRNAHVAGFDTCIGCHDPHKLEVNEAACATCHAGTTSPQEIRGAETPDYDGDAASEGVYGEIETLREALLAQIQAYATEKSTAIAYDSHSYPYFFNDTNANGVADPDEAVRSNGYKGFTPNLLKAAYNYQLATKDPGSFAHNPTFIAQVLIDSIEAIGGDISKYTRP
jgi:hypothetical protein